MLVHNKKLFRAIIILFVIALVAGLTLVTINFPYTSENIMKCGFNSNDNSIQIKKVKENGKFYINLTPDNTRISCTKQQYDYLQDDGTYYLRYGLLFYNKHIGKLDEISNQNILH